MTYRSYTLHLPSSSPKHPEWVKTIGGTRKFYPNMMKLHESLHFNHAQHVCWLLLLLLLLLLLVYLTLSILFRSFTIVTKLKVRHLVKFYIVTFKNIRNGCFSRAETTFSLGLFVCYLSVDMSLIIVSNYFSFRTWQNYTDIMVLYTFSSCQTKRKKNEKFKQYFAVRHWVPSAPTAV